MYTSSTRGFPASLGQKTCVFALVIAIAAVADYPAHAQNAPQAATDANAPGVSIPPIVIKVPSTTSKPKQQKAKSDAPKPQHGLSRGVISACDPTEASAKQAFSIRMVRRLRV